MKTKTNLMAGANYPTDYDHHYQGSALNGSLTGNLLELIRNPYDQNKKVGTLASGGRIEIIQTP